jgi:hypothetical protein
MSPKTEAKILRKLERIEKLLIKVIPQKTELTEEDVLKIIEEGNREYREGKTEDLEVWLKREYPQYVKKNRAFHKV